MSAAAPTLAGGCLCGAVRYRLEGAPLRVGVCHCSMCRRYTGAPYAALAVYDRAQLVHEDGTQAHYDTPSYRRYFCPSCGSATYDAGLSETTIDVYLGALDNPAALVPTYELWAEDAAPWTPRDPGWLSYPAERTGPVRREEA